MPKYFCRYANGQYGPSQRDNPISAGTALQAAVTFWRENRRNHPLPAGVDVLNERHTYQVTVELALEVVPKWLEAVDNSRFPVDKPVDNFCSAVDKPVDKMLRNGHLSTSRLDYLSACG